MAKDEQKIQGERVIRPKAIILPAGHPLIDKLKPDQVIVVEKDNINFGDSYVKNSPFAPVISEVAEGTDPSLRPKDAPDLSDISVYTPLVRKRRATNNEIYYEIVFKVRNSAIDPSGVIGVDARIVGTEPQND